jgi:hypothetical protein
MFAQNLFNDIEQFVNKEEQIEIQFLKRTIFLEKDPFDKILAELELKRLYSKIKLNCLEQAFDYLLVHKTNLTGDDLDQLRKDIKYHLTVKPDLISDMIS